MTNNEQKLEMVSKTICEALRLEREFLREELHEAAVANWHAADAGQKLKASRLAVNRVQRQLSACDAELFRRTGSYD